MKIMFASLDLCYPANNGNKKTGMDLLNHLIKSGHEVHYIYPEIAKGDQEGLSKYFNQKLTAIPSKISMAKRLRSSINARIWSRFSVPSNSYLSSTDLLRAAKNADVLIFDYWVTLRDYLQIAPNNKKPIVLKANDLIWPRIHTKNKFAHPLVAAMKAAYCHQELATLRAADTAFVVSLDEVQTLKDKNIFALHIPVACDLATFRPRPSISKLQNTALFVGASNAVNTNALIWLVEQVIPHIKQRIPDFMLHVLWHNPSKEILALFEAHPFLKRHDWVDDIATFYNRFPIALSPFFNATGVKVKLIEALASGCAVVSTKDGITGTAVRSSVDAMIADDPDIFARHIETLLSDTKKLEQFSQAARTFAKKHHDINHAFDSLDEWFTNCDKKHLKK